METKYGHNLICKSASEHEFKKYFDSLTPGDRIVWCDQCFDCLTTFRRYLQKSYSILVSEVDKEKKIVEVTETKRSLLEAMETERIRALPPKVFDANNLWN